MHSETLELKQKWNWSKQAYKRFPYILRQREELHNAIENLQAELQTAPADKINLQLIELRLKRRELDHLLDECEELTEESIALIEKELVDQILLAFPEQRAWWEQRQGFMREAQQVDKEWAGLYEGCARLQGALKLVCALRQSVAGLGMFNYIFGMSPNAAISRALQQAAAAIKAILPLANAYYLREHNASRVDFYRQLIEFLKETEKQVCQSWGFRHLDTHVRAAENNLKVYVAQIDAFKTAATTGMAHLAQEEVAWIERLA